MANQGMPGNFAGNYRTRRMTLSVLTNVEHKLDCAREKNGREDADHGQGCPICNTGVHLLISRLST